MTTTQSRTTARVRVYDALMKNEWTNLTVEENQIRYSAGDGRLTRMSAYSPAENLTLVVWFGARDEYKGRDITWPNHNIAGWARKLPEILTDVIVTCGPKRVMERAFERGTQQLLKDAQDAERIRHNAALDAAIRERVQQALEARIEARLGELLGARDFVIVREDPTADPNRWLAHRLAVDILSSDVLIDDQRFEFEGEFQIINSRRVVAAMFTREA